MFYHFLLIYKAGGPNFHRYDSKVLSCHWDRLRSQAYDIFLSILGICLPSLLILFFYTKIFIFANKQKGMVLTQSKRKKLALNIRLAKGLVGSFLLFAVSWLAFNKAF
jgi:hypothetical protein